MSFLKTIVVFFFCISLTAEAQDFHAGIRGGLIGSQVDGDSYEGFDKAGITAGIFVTRNLGEHFSLRMEMNYIQKGSRKPVDDLNTYYLMRLSYIEVPLMFQWKASPSFTLFAGPSYGVLISSYEENELGPLNYMQPFRKYEIALRAGLSYKLNENWSVDARYGDDVVTVRPFSAGYYPNYFQSGQFNRWVELGLEYRF